MLGASGCGTAGSSRDGALRLRDVLNDRGSGLGTTIGDAGFDFGCVFVFVVVAVLGFVVFDFPRVIGGVL